MLRACEKHPNGRPIRTAHCRRAAVRMVKKITLVARAVRAELRRRGTKRGR
jgi:hypothetical protein